MEECFQSSGSVGYVSALSLASWGGELMGWVGAASVQVGGDGGGYPGRVKGFLVILELEEGGAKVERRGDAEQACVVKHCMERGRWGGEVAAGGG